MAGSFLGPSYDDEVVVSFLGREGIPYERVEYDELPARVAGLLAEGKVVGWFQGRMEFGPRALGARSILADPRGRDVQRTVNLKIKFRESFRPFAPSVRAERASDYFDLDVASPYMLLVASVRGATIEGEGLERLEHVDSPVPAVTHVDGSARVQTVHEETNPLFHRLLLAFEALTGCGVLVNTSFNVRGEPIVCTPADAYRCFRGTRIDALALGPCLVLKDDLPDADSAVYTTEQVAQAYGLD
jgi:carbamoyltransferase